MNLLPAPGSIGYVAMFFMIAISLRVPSRKPWLFKTGRPSHPPYPLARSHDGTDAVTHDLANDIGMG